MKRTNSLREMIEFCVVANLTEKRAWHPFEAFVADDFDQRSKPPAGFYQ